MISAFLALGIAAACDSFGPGLPKDARIQTVVAGGNHSCALTTEGRAFCWGWNHMGQLGTGDSIPRTVPTAVQGELRFTQLTIASDRTCGVTVSAEPYCWGSRVAAIPERQEGPLSLSLSLNFLGSLWTLDFEGAVRLGDGSALELPAPLRTISSGGRWGTRTDVGGGRWQPGPFPHTCGLDSQGNAYCWGQNQNGQLGHGADPSGGGPEVTGGLRFTKLSARSNPGSHVCAVTTEGLIACWGRNASGELGTVTGTECDIPGRDPEPCSLEPVFIDSEQSFMEVAVGSNSSCGVTTEGEMHCWGKSLQGDEGASAVPLPVPTRTRFRQVSVGLAHACAVSFDDDWIYCWGANASGQLGDGTMESRSTPVPVARN